MGVIDLFALFVVQCFYVSGLNFVDYVRLRRVNRKLRKECTLAIVRDLTTGGRMYRKYLCSEHGSEEMQIIRRECICSKFLTIATAKYYQPNVVILKSGMYTSRIKFINAINLVATPDEDMFDSINAPVVLLCEVIQLS